MADDEIVQQVKIEVNEEGLSTFDKLKDAAQNAFDAIKQIFEGGDFGASFDKIKESGTKAFEELKNSGTDAFEKVKKAGSESMQALAQAAEANAEIIGTVFLGAAAAVLAIGTAFAFAGKYAFGLAEAAAKAVNALGDLSDKTRTSIQDVSELQTAFAHAGVSSGEFASGFAHLSDAVDKAWEGIKKSTKDGADSLEQKSLSAARATQQLVEAERALSGIKPDTNTKLIEEQRQKLQELRQAQLSARQAEKAENEARMNEIQQITRGVEDLIAGNDQALKSFNASAENIIKGVVAAAGGGSEALKGLGESFADVGSKAPNVKDVLTVLATALKNIEDPALRSKVATEALGKSAQSFLSAIDSGKLNEFIDNVQKMGGAFSEADKKIAGDFKNALQGLGKDIDNIKDKFGLAFGEGFTDILKTLDDFFTRNQSNIQRFAESISSLLLPPLKLAAKGFVALGEAANLTMDILRNIFNLIKDITSLKGLKIIEDFKALYEILKAVAEILTGQVKKGLDDLAKLRNQQKQEDNKAAQDKTEAAKTDEERARQARTDEQNKQKTDTKQLTAPEQQRQQAKKDAEDAQRQQAKQDAEDRKLLDDFKRFQDTLPPGRFDKQPDIPQQIKDAQDFQKFKQQVPVAPADNTGSFGDRFAESAGRFGEAAAKIPEQISSAFGSLGDVLKNILENGTPNAPKGTTPDKTQSATTSDLPSTLENLFKSLTDTLGQLVNKPGEKITDPNSGIGGADQEAAQSATQLASALDTAKASTDQLTSIGDSASNVSSSLDSVGTSADNAADPLSTLATAAADAAAALQNIQTGAASGNTVSAAGGGHVWGEGTETSDSIPAYLSKNEFVHRAAAVRHYGVDFMHAINTLQFPKFNMGGLVGLFSPQLPRFAGGGVVHGGASSSMPHLGTVDLTTDHGSVRVAMAQDGLGQLRRAAVRRNMGSTPKPSWVK